MAPRTGSSPPPYNFYEEIDEDDAQPSGSPDCCSSGSLDCNSSGSLDCNSSSSPDCDSSHSSPTHLAAPSTLHSARTSRTNNSTRRNVFSILSHLNISPRVLSSTTVQTAALIAVYTICITTLWFIFCASYLLTFYDDTKKLVRTSRVWARVKHGVHERLSMMGEDWEGLAKKYFDQPWTEFNPNNADANKNAPLNDQQRNPNPGSTKTPEKEWEEWLKTMMFKFVTNVAGQETSNMFYQSSGGRFGRPAAQTAAGSNEGHH